MLSCLDCVPVNPNYEVFGLGLLVSSYADLCTYERQQVKEERIIEKGTAQAVRKRSVTLLKNI